MRIALARRAIALLAIAGLASCTDSGLAPHTRPSAPSTAARGSSPQLPRPALLISQVYGGGGNSGSKYKNDFIELYNPGAAPVTVDGWSVQYASKTGTSWQVTKLAGTIQPGHYYLVQEAAGSGGTDALPDADVKTGAIPMGASDGKVALSSGTTALSGACPAAAVNIVSYGAASDCGAGTTAAASNTRAAIRNDGGCAYSGSLADDFTIDLPTPRNGASPVHVCPGTFPLGALDHVTLTGASTVMAGGTTQLKATAEDSHNQAITDVALAWTSSDESLASVDTDGVVTGVAPSSGPVTITVKATSGDIEKSATLQLTVTLPVIAWIDMTSSSASFPPGFQTQIFATARTAKNGPAIPAIFTFASANPEIATIATVANTGIVTGVSAPADGTKPGIIVTATPVAGGASYSFTSHPITIEPPVFADASTYAKNDEFGDPTSATASDANDRLIVRNQYTLSYNASRGTPNWVSYEIDARQFGAEDRCNCFTADPTLPAEERIYTSDYTNGGYDRGHMARSADRTVANGDNATTFYLTNIVPQKADLNQGVWAQFENALGDSAKAGRAVYVITGPLYSRGKSLKFLKDEGKVAIPDSTWKVAIIGPDKSAPFTVGDIDSWEALAGTTVLAVNMPNDSGVRNDPWSKYLTTVRRIEASTGYDFLSLLPRAFQDAVERGDRAPVAKATSRGDMNEGSSITFDGSSSVDPDLGRTDMEIADALAYSWQFSDGGSATGAVAQHAFANDGIYTATLTVTDAYGWQRTTTVTDTIANVAPVIASLPGATILRGESYVANGSFTDPGSDPWTATVDFGDGAGAQPLSLDDHAFSLAHAYGTPGSYTLSVSVSDDHTTTTTQTTVVVESSAQGIANLRESLAALGPNAARTARAGGSTLNAGELNSLEAKLRNADAQLGRGDVTATGNTLGAFVNEMQAMAQSGRVDPTVAAAIVAYARRVIASL